VSGPAKVMVECFVMPAVAVSSFLTAQQNGSFGRLFRSGSFLEVRQIPCSRISVLNVSPHCLAKSVAVVRVVNMIDCPILLHFPFSVCRTQARVGAHDAIHFRTCLPWTDSNQPNFSGFFIGIFRASTHARLQTISRHFRISFLS
jgi:hypothetical protein